MKVVVNRCFGGFGLSRACFIELFERGAKIIERKSFKEATSSYRKPGQDWPSDEYEAAEESNWFRQRHLGSILTDCGVYAAPGADAIYCNTSDADEHRSDPDLVALIEERGSEWASGRCANLEVVEIPDDVEWTIEEYDGNEHVAEKHKTW
jgi:hypothetical protein